MRSIFSTYSYLNLNIVGLKRSFLVFCRLYYVLNKEYFSFCLNRWSCEESGHPIEFGRKKNINSLNRTRVYSQLLLDDFLLSAIRARNGWWANKYGINLGLEVSNKTKDSLKTAKKYFVEFTYMRPYVFSQTNPGIVYGNQGLPIGHSLGSNFAELFQEYSYFSFLRVFLNC